MLKEILIEMKKYPTIMDINDEIFFIAKIQKNCLNEIKNNESIFFEILNLLDSSHEQTIFQVNEENIETFKNFSRWVRNLKNIFFDKKNHIETFAENMEATFG